MRRSSIEPVRINLQSPGDVTQWFRSRGRTFASFDVNAATWGTAVVEVEVTVAEPGPYENARKLGGASLELNTTNPFRLSVPIAGTTGVRLRVKTADETATKDAVVTMVAQ